MQWAQRGVIVSARHEASKTARGEERGRCVRGEVRWTTVSAISRCGKTSKVAVCASIYDLRLDICRENALYESDAARKGCEIQDYAHEQTM